MPNNSLYQNLNTKQQCRIIHMLVKRTIYPCALIITMDDGSEWTYYEWVLVWRVVKEIAMSSVFVVMKWEWSIEKRDGKFYLTGVFFETEEQAKLHVSLQDNCNDYIIVELKRGLIN